MIPKELSDQLQNEVNRLKKAGDDFLQTYTQLCVHCGGGPQWQKEPTEMVFHRVRSEVIPVMEQAGMDAHAVQAFCSWAERLVKKR
jgi:hypothetical protein